MQNIYVFQDYYLEINNYLPVMSSLGEDSHSEIKQMGYGDGFGCEVCYGQFRDKGNGLGLGDSFIRDGVTIIINPYFADGNGMGCSSSGFRNGNGANSFVQYYNSNSINCIGF